MMQEAWSASSGAALPAVAVVAAAWAVYNVARVTLGTADVKLQSRRDPPPDAFHGKVVWVTGASQGLGEALVVALAARGAKLVLSARRQAALSAVAAKLPRADQVVVLPLDVTGGAEALRAAVAHANAAFDGQGVDVLIHMAGSSQRGRAHEMGAEADDALMQLNALAPMALTKAMLPSMLARRSGHVVLISSMAARIPSPGQATYAAAKAAVSAYHHTAHCEVCDKGVDVSVVYAGPVAAIDGHPGRTLYGPSGAQTVLDTSSKGRLEATQFVRLLVRAIWHRRPQCWIAAHPVLAMAYLSQYLPTVAAALLRKIGPARTRALDGANQSAGGGGGGGGGGSGAQDAYSLSALLSKRPRSD